MKLSIYILAFIEGFLVMAFELLSARLLAPYFGNSIYVWSAVLGITMIALLLGYFLGGRIANKSIHYSLAIFFIIISAVYLVLLPVVSNVLIHIQLSFDLITGVLLSSCLLLLPPLVLLGSVSPQFIEFISDKNLGAGISSGNIYSISTLGGVMATFLTGLYLIPQIGIVESCIIIGLCTSAASLLSIIYLKKYISSFAFTLVLLFTSVFTNKIELSPTLSAENYQTVYSNDSMMGKLEVVKKDSILVLLNNGAIQSKFNSALNSSLLLYTHAIAGVAAYIPKRHRNDALLVGLAGGSLVHELQELEFGQITAVDIDPRTKIIAEDHFNVKRNSFEFIEDDGRHFLQKTKKTYNLIVIDVSAGDSQPYHLYTLEAFKEYKNKLNPNGLLIINIIDFIQRSKYTTTEKIGDGLFTAGYEPYLLKNLYSKKYSRYCIENEIPHEKIIVASLKDVFHENEVVLNNCCSSIPYVNALSQNWHRMTELKTSLSTQPFVDNLPEMELMSYDKAKKLRASLN